MARMRYSTHGNPCIVLIREMFSFIRKTLSGPGSKSGSKSMLSAVDSDTDSDSDAQQEALRKWNVFMTTAPKDRGWLVGNLAHDAAQWG